MSLEQGRKWYLMNSSVLDKKKAGKVVAAEGATP